MFCITRLQTAYGLQNAVTKDKYRVTFSISVLYHCQNSLKLNSL